MKIENQIIITKLLSYDLVGDPGFIEARFVGISSRSYGEIINEEKEPKRIYYDLDPYGDN